MRTLVVVCLTLLALTAAAAPSERTIAVTFDDLPAGSVLHPDAVGMREILQPIVDSCAARRIPAIGFVNENKLYVEGKLVPARRQLLAVWLEAGLELGNHSYSHPDLHHMPTDEYLDDVARGEAVTRSLLALRGEELRWFRHPFLHTGRSFEAKRVVEGFLAKRGVAVAPVTVDNDDYLFAAAWDRAAERGDAATQTRLEAAYVPYMVDKWPTTWRSRAPSSDARSRRFCCCTPTRSTPAASPPSPTRWPSAATASCRSPRPSPTRPTTRSTSTSAPPASPGSTAGR